MDPGAEGPAAALILSPILWATWLSVLAVLGGYRQRNLGSGVEEFQAVIRAGLTSVLVIATVCYLSGIDLPRRYLVPVGILGVVFLCVQRYAIRKAVHLRCRRGLVTRRILLVGSQEGVSRLGGNLEGTRHLGYAVSGCTVTDPGRHHQGQLPAQMVGWAHDVRRAARLVDADTVMVADGSDVDLREISWNLEGAGLDLIVVPRLADVAAPRMHMRPVAGLPLLHVSEPQAVRAGAWPKRLFDLVGAGVGLLLISPVLAIVALLIKMNDGGPVLFRQRRVGLHGETFECWKFRSMRIDAPELEASLRVAEGHEGALFKMTSDPRITSVGAVLRRYSIDELPQLFNVLGGSMSLVGPRPQQQWEVDTYSDADRRRLHVRPGMTGLWQVSGRSNLSWDDAIRLDLYYRDNWSMMTDFLIIGRTIKAVLGQDGAY